MPFPKIKILMIEIYETLSPLNKQVVAIYSISGGVSVLLSYWIYSLPRIRREVRWSISAFILMFGFILLSACGKILNGYPENYTILTLWVVILATIFAIWVGVALYKLNQQKINKHP